VSRVVDVAREVDTGMGDDVAQEGKLGDASVFYLDVTEAVESLLVGAIEQAEGIEEAERGLGSELGLEGVEGRGSLGRGGGGKGSGRCTQSPIQSHHSQQHLILQTKQLPTSLLNSPLVFDFLANLLDQLLLPPISLTAAFMMSKIYNFITRQYH